MQSRRTRIGLTLTAVWFLGVVALVWWKRGDLATMQLNTIGDFLAGAVSPVAFLWIIIGYFQQGEELRQNTKALELQYQELQNAVQEYRQMAEASKRQVDLLEATHREQSEADKRDSELNLRVIGDKAGSKVAGAQQYTVSLRNISAPVYHVQVNCSLPYMTGTSYWHHLDANEAFELWFEYPPGTREYGYLQFDYVDRRDRQRRYSLQMAVTGMTVRLYHRDIEGPFPADFEDERQTGEPVS